ncbi:MAG: beta-galactosidase [Chthonomonadaceae bacterium]|nr:beta-galactosidase [Chthonomonadaceae bacterium]
MHLGAAWYPEHWNEERWETDVRLMKEAGMTVCRIGEFAWSTMEPYEGGYHFEWLEKAVTLLNRYGLEVVLGTPTAAPPAWLTHRYRDTLAVDEHGRTAVHGNRCHTAANSQTYLKFCRKITGEMAKRFGKDARVIGWQIDNEYNRVDYSENSRRQFQHWLKDQYTSLDALNSHWSTAYWSQTYSNWDEIPLPVGAHNPGLMLAFKRFVTHTWREFQKVQIDEIRHHSLPSQWITHNFMGWFDAFDHYELTADLDFATWDWYVGTGHHDFTKTGAAHDLTRGFKRKNFWIMETQPGWVNWSGVNNTLNKGEASAMAWHAVAHGADAILYWQWRSAQGGQEQLHGSLIGADGNPRPFYEEVKVLGENFAKVSEVIANTEPKNEIAFLYSYDARWSINGQKHHKDFNSIDHLMRYYSPLAERNISVDILSPLANLSGYKIVVLPALVILPDVTVENLTRFVESGGTLVITVRTGMKDTHNSLFDTLQPGKLRELAGAEVEEYYALLDPAPVHFRGNEQSIEEKIIEGKSEMWAEALRPLSDSTQVLAHFGESNGWLDGKPAITLNPVGENGGKVLMIGAVLDSKAQSFLIERILREGGIEPIYTEGKTGVEVAKRVGKDGKTVTLVINHTREERSLDLKELAGQDLLSGKSLSGVISLLPYGVRVLI